MTTTTAPLIRVCDDPQGSDEWLDARRGMVTASVIGSLITASAPDALTVDCVTCGALAGESCISTARKTPTPIKVERAIADHAAEAHPEQVAEYNRRLEMR
jgi:hypothetical protein